MPWRRKPPGLGLADLDLEVAVSEREVEAANDVFDIFLDKAGEEGLSI